MNAIYEFLNIGLVHYLFGAKSVTEDGITIYTTPILYIIPAFILLLLIGYLLGSINFAMFISKKKYKDDIREHGSGNAGMTNMMRTYGSKAAGLTLAGDAIKTVVAALVGYCVLGVDGAYVAGLGAVIGHTWPLYYNFKGGKGVVTTIATILCTSPLTGLILLVVFVAIVAMSKYISLGSIMGALLYPLILSAFAGIYSLPQLIVCFGITFLVVFNHRANIKRLLDGTENKFAFKKSK